MIYYAVYYSLKDSDRSANFAGEDKVDYICDVINRCGEDVTLISSAKTLLSRFAPKETFVLTPHKKLVYFSSLPKKNNLLHAIDVLWGYIQLIVYVLKNVKKNDTVLVYHSLGYRNLWKWLKRIKKFHYVLEVEEIFQSIKASKSSFKKKEMTVFRYPDAFICSNKFLNDASNKNGKPFAIVNGIYKMAPVRHTTIDSFLSKKVVYAGSFEKQKGVDFVIDAARFLPVGYELHIIGFGSSEDVARVKRNVEIVQRESNAKVSYDGLYKGEDYIRFLQSCDVGVCIQDENDEFNKFEYPSKIFSYLSNGLNVVVNDLIQVKNSDVYPYLFITKGTNPIKIANAMVAAFDSSTNATQIMDKLDSNFLTLLKTILKRR